MDTVVRIIDKNITNFTTYYWTPGSDIDPNAGYRLILYYSQDPRIWDISDEFEIY